MANDYERALEILDRIGGKRQVCPVCGGDEWAPGRGPHLIPVLDESEAQHPIDKGGDVTLRGARAIGVACQGCGFTRFFNIDMLLRRES